MAGGDGVNAVNKDDIKKLIDSGREFRYKETDFSSDGDLLIISGRIAYPVFPVQHSVSGGPDIPITEPGGNTIGTLVLGSRLTFTDPSSFTDDQYVAYLTEASTSQLGADYRFQFDYVIIDFSDKNNYETSFLRTSGLWGGFTHITFPRRVPQASAHLTTSIKASNNLELPTVFHEENLFRSSQVTFAFERFLKLYHLLELMFDWHLVEKLKKIEPDLRNFGELISSYSSKELDRLNSVVADKLADASLIALALNNVKNHAALAKKIFFNYGKKDNPHKDISEFDEFCKQGYEFQAAKNIRTKIDQNQHRDLIVKAACYFIYRIRCCIAHSKIGEYVMVQADESFVIDFGEPLLRAVLLQVFQKQKTS